MDPLGSDPRSDHAKCSTPTIPDGIVKEADSGRNLRKRPLRLDKSVVGGMDDLAIDEVEYFATAVVDAVDAWSAGIAETL